MPASIAAVPRRPRRARALALVAAALAVVAAGCARSNLPDEETTAPDPRVLTDAATSLPPGTAPVGPPGSPATTATAPSARATVTTRAATAATSRAPTTRAAAATANAGDQAIRAVALGPPGGAAGVILQPAPATSLVVEVLEEPGISANRVALNRVLSDLRKYSGKAVSEVRTPLPPGSSARRWTEPELEAVANRASRVPQGGGRFVMRLMFVKGGNVRSPNILAESFRGDLVAAFPERYASSGQHIVTTVTVHEVGHLLGLVDLYLDRNRADTERDPARGGHSRNPGSVMYWAVDPSLLGALFGSASDRFDAQDERDMAAIRAGAPRGSNPA